MTHIGLLDWAIIGVSLAATLGLGLAVKRHVGSLEDYLVASRGMGLYVGTASLVSTEIGIITYMYQAQFGFLAGFSAFVVGLLTLAVCVFVGTTGFVVSRLREMEIMTVPEYLEKRYSRRVRILAGLFMAFGGSLNLGIFPIIEARFLSVVLGIDARHVAWTMAALLLMALAYTALGGMVSLLLTNYLQYLILAAGTVVVTIACLGAVGWTGMSGAVRDHLQGRGTDPLADLGVGFIFWQLLLWVAFMTVWQSVAMRTFSARDPATVRKVFTLTSGLFLGRAVIPMMWGIAALAFFWGRAQPLPAAAEPPAIEMQRLEADLDRTFATDLSAGRLEALLPPVERLETLAAEQTGEHAERAAASARAKREEIGLVAMPWMLSSLLPTGLLGLVIAGMLAASVSTYAGYFLGWSAVIAQDVVAPSLQRELSPKARLLLTRATVVALTLFIMAWSLLYEVPGPAYFYLQVTANLFMAPTLITIVAGLYWKRASPAGAHLAFLLGAAASLGYLVPGLRLSVATAGNLSWALAALGLLAGSLLFPRRGLASAPEAAA
jgi:SSS family solute:Na+ symporter